MDILMIVETDYPNDIRVKNEIKSLIHYGHNIHLICPTQNKNRVGSFRIDGATVHRFFMTNLRYKTSVGQLKFPFYYNFLYLKIIKIIDELDQVFKAIHVHDLSLAKIGKKLSEKLKCKSVLDLHENYPYLIKDAHHTQKGLGKFLSDYSQWISYEKKIVKEFKNIITVVEEMKQRMLIFDNRANAYHIYQNVINADDIPDYSPPYFGNKLKLIYVGGITPSRGIQTVIEAVNLIPQKYQITFNIYGKGIYVNHLKEIVKSKHLEERIKFEGFIDQKNVIKTIQDHHLAIIPHYRSVQNNNSSPNKLFQYMSTGRAVIGTNCDSIERIIETCKAGSTYSDRNPEDLKNRLINFINNPSLITEMGENGYNAVSEVFNTAIEGKRLNDLYNNLN